MSGRDDVPWEANACLTIKAGSEREVNDVLTKLDRYARRIGAGAVFTDYSGPQAEPTGDYQRGVSS